MPDKPDTIYHYCGISGFHGILASKTLWLSDAYFMNDHMEHRWVLEKAVAQLAALATEGADRRFCEQLARFLISMPIHPYICCFSLEADLLSQWRAYSDDGAGFAIGFSRVGVEKQCASYEGRQLPISLDRVEYDGEKQEKLLADSIARFQRRHAEQFPGQGPLGNDDFCVVLPAYGCLWRIAAFCKNRGFREERECRILLAPQVRDLGTPDQKVADVGTSEMCFRVSGNRLVPYFTFPFATEAVAEARLGPRNHDRETRYAIEMFLRKHGYDAGRVSILNSEATYR